MKKPNKGRFKIKECGILFSLFFGKSVSAKISSGVQIFPIKRIGGNCFKKGGVHYHFFS